MRYKVVFNTLGIVLILFGLTLFLPIFVGLIYNEPILDLYLSFGVPLIITWTLGFILWFLTREASEDIRDREAFVIVAIGWLLIALLGSLPYLFSGTLSNPIDAYFESMSGFATCGATVIDYPTGAQDYLDVYPHSIFFWRALTQWIGGMGIIVFSVVILAKVLGGGMTLFKAEVAGGTMTRLKPTVRQTARLLWSIYFIFTVLEILFLLAAGMDLFDATTHSFTTLATGGFGTHKASIEYYSQPGTPGNGPLIESIIIMFMLIGSISFVLHYRLFQGKIREVTKDPSLRFYMLTTVIGILLITSELTFRTSMGLGNSFRYAAFNLVSIHATAGYSSTDFGQWPFGSQLILLMAMFIGGSVGSTSGALKVTRVLILFKTAKRQIQRVIHPRAVVPVTVGGETIPDAIVDRVSIFFFAYIFTFAFSTLLMTFFGMDIVSGASAVATTMGGVGPGLGSVSPSYTFVGLHPFAKIWLSICMWLGRLEIFAGVIMFMPETYKR